jgi:hypothetical protein
VIFCDRLGCRRQDGVRRPGTPGERQAYPAIAPAIHGGAAAVRRPGRTHSGGSVMAARVAAIHDFR